MKIDIDALAQEIRRVDGSNSLGAGALAEALMPFLSALPANPAQVTDAMVEAARDICVRDVGVEAPSRDTIIEALTAAIGAGGETVPAEWYATANKQRNEAEKNANHWHGEIEAIGAMFGIGAPDAGEVPAAVQAAIGAGGQAVAEVVEHTFDIEHYNEPDNIKALALKLAVDRGGQTTPVSDYDVCRAREIVTGEIKEVDRLKRELAEARAALSQPHPADERVVEALREAANIAFDEMFAVTGAPVARAVQQKILALAQEGRNG